jgi:CHAT domain-containing protein
VLLCGFTPGFQLVSAAFGSQAGVQDYLLRGQDALRRGQSEQTVSEWEQVLAIAERNGEKNKRIELHGRLASVYLQRGKYPQSIAHLDAALQLAGDSDDPVQHAQLKRQLGTVYLAGGHIEAARKQLEGALELARQSGNPAALAAVYNDLANLQMQEHAYAEALELYMKSSAALPGRGNELQLARAEANGAAAAVEIEQYPQARTLIQGARDQLQRLDDSHDKTFLLLRLGVLSEDLHARTAEQTDLTDTYMLLREALQISESLGDSSAGAYALGYLADLYEKQGRTEEALRLSQQASFLAQASASPESLYRWQWQTARLLYVQGNRNKSLTSYRQAVATLGRIRAELLMRISGDRDAFAETVTSLYREYVDLLLELGMSSADTDRRAGYLWEVQEAMERFKAAELQDYFQDECVATAREKVKRIDAALAPGTAVIYPIVLAHRTVLLLTYASGMEAVVVELQEKQLNDEVAAFRHTLEKRTTREYLLHARQLYDWLLKPIETSLSAHNIDTLVVIPGGALRTIPLAALHDGRQFLIQKYAIATTPGLELTDPRPIDRQNIKILMSGLTVPQDGFSGLPHVEEELDAIQQLYGGRRLQDDTFVTSALRRELEGEDYAIVHIASHGKFEAETEESFIQAFDDRLRLNQLELYMSVSRYREHPVELLTLSACQTAAGDKRAALGLAGVAVKAGVRSALATLWTINDQATALLIEEFYDRLQDASLSKARSLQHAQIKLLEDLRYRHPGYWSAFLLIGNWQ